MIFAASGVGEPKFLQTSSPQDLAQVHAQSNSLEFWSLATASPKSNLPLVTIAEILAELPKLKAEDRSQLLARLCELQENDFFQGIGPVAEDHKLLDAALTEYEQDGHPGRPWREVLQLLHSSPTS